MLKRHQHGQESVNYFSAFLKDAQIAEYFSGSTTENMMTVRNGIEGKHWKYDENDVPVGIGKYEDWIEVAKMGADTVLVDIDFPEHEIAQGDPAMYLWADENKFDVGVVRTPLTTTLPSEEKYLTELDKIQAEAYIAIITGDKPIDYFDEFVEEWYSAGGEQLVNEANEWYSKQAK